MPQISPRKWLIILIILVGTLATASPGSAEGESKRKPAIKLLNKTDRPIYVYLNGKYITRCEAKRCQTLDCAHEGDVTGVGRFRCDTWGPKQLTLRDGETTRWVFRDEPKPATSQPSAR